MRVYFDDTMLATRKYTNFCLGDEYLQPRPQALFPLFIFNRIFSIKARRGPRNVVAIFITNEFFYRDVFNKGLCVDEYFLPMIVFAEPFQFQ